MTFIGFSDNYTVPQRTKWLQDFLRLNVPTTHYLSIDPIMKGPHNKRVPTPNMTVLFATQTTRDNTLEQLKDTKPTTPDGNTLRLDRTKTQRQLDRNSALYEAKERLTKHPTTRNKNITIDWKERTVTVDNTPAFTQAKRDLTGTFTSTYTDLSF